MHRRQLKHESKDQTSLLRQAQKALRQSERRYRQLLELSLDAIWMHHYGIITFVNSACVELLGANKAEELVGRSVLDFVHPDSREAVAGQNLLVRNRSRPAPALELKLLRLDGASVDAEVAVDAIVGQGRKSYLVVARDIAARKVAEAAQRESQARKSAMLESALDAIVTIDQEGRIFEWNPAAEKIFGYRRATVLGKELAQLIIPPSLREQHRQGLGRYLATGATSVLGKRTEMTALRADGKEFPVELSIARIAHDGPPIFTGFIRDITDRKHIEEQLRQIQKMDSIGRLAGGVAHDFNNLLAVMQGYLYIVLEREDLGEATRGDLNQILGAAERASNLTRQLLLFSRKQPAQLQPLYLNEAIDNLAKFLRRIIGEDIKLQIHSQSQLPQVEADLGMVEQVVMNLAVNARDAMPDGGFLTINTEGVTVESERALRNPEARMGKFVCLTVQDTGCGIPPEILTRIFEPFFTTKSVGKGTGLGLATVFGIVSQHRGWIEVESRTGAGTTIKVFLPASARAAAGTEKEQRRITLRRGSGTILLVEDEIALRGLTRILLEEYGYRALEAGSGVEALSIWKNQRGKIDLLFTDMILPDGITGRELAKQLKARKPELKVIYTSGYALDLDRTGVILREGLNFLQKPSKAERIIQAVQDMLGE
jgi:two-component system cell cycle sensor histidine kinase/response regulator CckA